MIIRTTLYQHTYCRERKFFYASAVFLCILFVVYIYFVSAAIAHVVVRKELSQEIKAVQARISELEETYIAAEDAVDMNMAVTYGFLKNEEKIFVEKTDTATVLSLNDSR